MSTSAADSSLYSEDATRATFAQPGPTSRTSGQWSSPGYSGTIRQPAPSQTTTQAPRRQRITLLGWLGRGLVLVAISVVSGLAWYTIKNYLPQNTAPPVSQGPQTKYQYTPVGQAAGVDCKSVSDGQVKEFFTHTGCDRITRKLFTTTLAGDQRVLVSVITISMPNGTAAGQLRTLANASGTGQVYALSHGQKRWPSLDEDVAYQVQNRSNVVVITDAGYFGRAKQDKDPTLTDISKDAAELGWPSGTAPTN